MLLMYINENCKDVVMDLAIHVALANEVLEAEEEESLTQYYQELGVEDRGTNAKHSFEYCVKYLSEKTSIRERKMILFEMVALACSDGGCDEKEEKILETIYSDFEIDDKVVLEMKMIISKFRGIYEEIAELIGKEG